MERLTCSREQTVSNCTQTCSPVTCSQQQIPEKPAVSGTCAADTVPSGWPDAGQTYYPCGR